MLINNCRDLLLTDEVRFSEVSKTPDRFSRKLACKAYPESVRDIGENGRFGKTGDPGEEDIDADGVVEAVVGRSAPVTSRKTLKSGTFLLPSRKLAPNPPDESLASSAKWVEGAIC